MKIFFDEILALPDIVVSLILNNFIAVFSETIFQVSFDIVDAS